MPRVSYGPYIKSELINSGDNGVCPADLFSKLKKGVDIYKTNATYNSFMRYFHWYIQLGYVRKARTETSYQRGGNPEVLKAPRTYYVITEDGIMADADTKWTNPLTTVHPEWSSGGVKRREYMSKRVRERRPRGRPRKKAKI